MVNSHVKNEDTEEQKKNQIKQPPQELDQLLEAGHTSYCYNSVLPGAVIYSRKQLCWRWTWWCRVGLS